MSGLDVPDEQGSPLGDLKPLPRRRGSELQVGVQLDPVLRIRAFDPDQLESLVEHWVREKVVPRYAKVRHFGGSGDKGRDVVAYEDETRGDPWHNFQCKRYQDRLGTTDLWPDLGKLVYWTMEGSYSVPKTYTFVAPKGATPKAQELLDSPEKLRKGLKRNWKKKCATLCSLDEIKDHLDAFQFPDLDVVDGGEIVADLQGTAIFPYFFGGGLSKPRPPAPQPPPEIGAHELPYIGALVDAYDEHYQGAITSLDEALAHDDYGLHLRGSRREFYCAESLREFSKDVLAPPDNFGDLQTQVFDGIRHKLAEDHPTGYERVLAVCGHATSVQLDDHPLSGDLQPADRAGICHQLANDGKVKWRK